MESLFFFATSSSATASMSAACETSFKAVESNFASPLASVPSTVYVLKFDAGAGYVRVVSGHIFMVDRDSSGSMTSVEVLHDRGSGRYEVGDVFHPLNWPSYSVPKHQWRKALGLDGFTPVHLIAADRAGVRFIGRTQRGDLKLYQAHELFPLASSDR